MLETRSISDFGAFLIIEYLHRLSGLSIAQKVSSFRTIWVFRLRMLHWCSKVKLLKILLNRSQSNTYTNFITSYFSTFYYYCIWSDLCLISVRERLYNLGYCAALSYSIFDDIMLAVWNQVFIPWNWWTLPIRTLFIVNFVEDFVSYKALIIQIIKSMLHL